jgi:2-hydroxychromene-2-carboxylate isomerase
MTAPIEFWFDFSSPYGYLASRRIDTLAARHGRIADWKPYLMGAAMKLSGAQPLVDRRLVADYAARDLARSARRHDIPFALPEPFPVATVAACRAYWWRQAESPEDARALAEALLSAYFVEGRNIGETAVVVSVAAEQGLDPAAIQAGLGDQRVKDRVREVTDGAIARGIFGSPFVVVDGEPFWGNDRLEEVEGWIETGGW